MLREMCGGCGNFEVDKSKKVPDIMLTGSEDPVVYGKCTASSEDENGQPFKFDMGMFSSSACAAVDPVTGEKMFFPVWTIEGQVRVIVEDLKYRGEIPHWTEQAIEDREKKDIDDIVG